MSVPDWSSYDDIAANYDVISVSHYFQQPAERLVSLLAISPSDTLLDVGAGTGVVAANARHTASRVIATDPSWPMLLRGKARAVPRAVASQLPCLPFAPGLFDCVTASFVLNHLSNPGMALAEVSRVLRPGGRLGATSWAVGPSNNEVGRVWSDTANEFVDQSVLAHQIGTALPGEQSLADPQTVSELLSASELSVSLLTQLDLPVSISSHDYLLSRSLAMAARYMRRSLPGDIWRQFEVTVADRVLQRFGHHLEFTVRVNFAIATKRGAD